MNASPPPPLQAFIEAFAGPGALALASRVDNSQIVAINPRASVSSMRERLIEMCRAYRGSGLAADDSTFLVARRRPTLRPPSSN